MRILKNMTNYIHQKRPIFTHRCIIFYQYHTILHIILHYVQPYHTHVITEHFVPDLFLFPVMIISTLHEVGAWLQVRSISKLRLWYQVRRFQGSSS